MTEQNYDVRLLQPQAGNRHAVFHTHARESLAFHYERHPADPERAMSWYSMWMISAMC